MSSSARFVRYVVVFAVFVMAAPASVYGTPPTKTAPAAKTVKTAPSTVRKNTSKKRARTKARRAATLRKKARVRRAAKAKAKARRAAKARRVRKAKRLAKVRRAAKLRKRARARRALSARKRAGANRVKKVKTAKGDITPKAGKGRAAKVSTSASGRKVLETAQAMIDERLVVRGSCWDWVNAVFLRAGYQNKRGLRRTVFKGKKAGGPYASLAALQPGDWIYHVNHQYRGVGHSAIFVRWVDRSRSMAETISYAGSRRNKPGRYGIYDLSSVYRIIRPGR